MVEWSVDLVTVDPFGDIIDRVSYNSTAEAEVAGAAEARYLGLDILAIERVRDTVTSRQFKREGIIFRAVGYLPTKEQLRWAKQDDQFYFAGEEPDFIG